MKSRSLIVLALAGLFLVDSAAAQITSGPDANTSRKAGDDNECAIAKNPSNHLQLFALCNTSTAGLFAARTTDGGVTWTFPDAADKTIADGDANQGPAACCDPNLAWDTFGNLYVTYIDAGLTNIVTIVSTDGGLTFSNLVSFNGASVDQPSIAAVNTTSPTAPVAFWVVWNQGGSMVARGAAVTGAGVANIGAFTALQNIPGTAGCSFGDVAISPGGVVVQACGSPTGGQGPSTIRVNIDADGLGANNFGTTINATTTNVGGFDFIPAQAVRSVDPEAGLAYDSNNASPHFGRLYLVYTDETVDENNDTDIMLRFSDDDGANWSAPIRVNDDATTRSQFLPKIAVNPLSGNVGVCWHDARNSATNTAVQIFCSIATRLTATPTFMASAQVSDGASTSNGAGVEFGDYSGIAYFQGRIHPIWADISNSSADNPGGTATFDAYTDRVLGGTAASEGDPHLKTVNGVHFDFQGAGEFTALRDGDGMEIQFRHTPVETTFTPGADPYSGIATKVSLNTAVAARVGSHRVTFQPDVDGVPDPSTLKVRIDGAVVNLPMGGQSLGNGGRVMKNGDGINVDFPNGTSLVVTPGYWDSQGKWYLNVDVYHTPALEGVMGAIFPGSWLPLLPNGTSLGPRPASVNDRFNQLYKTFADAWRVKPATRLFDAGGPDLCVPSGWPRQGAVCVSRQVHPASAISAAEIATLCGRVDEKQRRNNCAFDLRATGDRGFARAYAKTENTELHATETTVAIPSESSPHGKPLTATVVVRPSLRKARPPRGTVQIVIDGERAVAPVSLDDYGRALVKLPILQPGKHKIEALFVPDRSGPSLPSRSEGVLHTVTATDVR
jgi:hypothetical protein